MPEIHARRRADAQHQLRTLGVDAALITTAVNVRYLTGLASSNAAQVRKIRLMLEEIGLRIATPGEARALLALKGPENVGF